MAASARRKSQFKTRKSLISLLVLAVAVAAFLLYQNTSSSALPGTPSASSTTAPTSPGASPVAERFVLTSTELFDARSALNSLTVRPKSSATPYKREAFGDAWTDSAKGVALAGNSCDTRNDILARDLTNITFGSTSKCAKRGVLKGTLNDPYTGRVIQYTQGAKTSAEIQIDHIAALENVWVSGGDKVSPEKRKAIANDPRNLIAVDGPTNGAKSSKDASEWMPPNQAVWCYYAASQTQVKKLYGLSVTAAEKTALSKNLDRCVPRK